jgi:hypothetical protein
VLEDRRGVDGTHRKIGFTAPAAEIELVAE